MPQALKINRMVRLGELIQEEREQQYFSQPVPLSHLTAEVEEARYEAEDTGDYTEYNRLRSLLAERAAKE